MIREELIAVWTNLKPKLKCLTSFEKQLITNSTNIFLHPSGINVAKQMKDQQVTPSTIKEVRKNYADKLIFPWFNLSSAEMLLRYPNLSALLQKEEGLVKGTSRLLAYCFEQKNE